MTTVRPAFTWEPACACQFKGQLRRGNVRSPESKGEHFKARTDWTERLQNDSGTFRAALKSIEPDHVRVGQMKQTDLSQARWVCLLHANAGYAITGATYVGTYQSCHIKRRAQIESGCSKRSRLSLTYPYQQLKITFVSSLRFICNAEHTQQCPEIWRRGIVCNSNPLTSRGVIYPTINIL